MSRSDRKRSSKWDLTEESRVPPENIEGNGPRRSAVEDNDMNSRKDIGYAAREPLHGSRGSHKYDSINEGHGRHLKATVGWERDESYNMRMSPGLDEWRQRSRSPKNNSSRPIRSKSRSRSRSPVRGYRRESVNFDRDRSRSGVSSQLCKDFASGRCRRGNHCPFSHQINENYEDNGESKLRKDGVSKYSSPHEVRDYPARGGRSTSPCGVRDYPTRSGRSPSPHGSRDYPPRGGRSPSPRGARDYPPRGGRSPSPRGARDYPTRGGRSTSPREARDYPARSGRSSEICNNFPKGKCFRGASCRYVHDGASDGFDKVTATESIRERDNDRYNRDASFDRGVERQTHRSDDIPCKFFAAGNCRNSSRCRFSHNGQAHVSTDRRPRDDRGGLHPGSEAGNQIWDGPKWSDTNAVSDAAKLNDDINDKMVPRNSSGDVNQAWDCPRWSDTNTTSDAAKLGEDKTVKMGVYEPNTTAWSSDDRLGQSLFNENKVPGDPTSIHKPAGHAEKDATQWNEQGAGDMEMSPDWKYAVPSANQFRKEEHDYVVHSSQSLVYNIPSLSTHDQSITKEASVPSFAGGASMLPTSEEKYYFQHNPKLMGAGATLLPCDGKGAFERTASSNTDLNQATTTLEGQSFEQNGQDSSVLPHSNVNAVGSQVVFTERPGGLSTMNSQDPELHGVGKLAHSPDIANANASQINPVIPQTQNVVTSEQLTQLTNISASLAKLLENGQELPKLYAALNPHSPLGAPSISNLGLPFQPASSTSIQLGTASVLQKQYDPMHDSIDLEKPDVNTTAPGFSADPSKQNTSAICADRKPTVPADAGGQSGGDFNSGNSREELNDEIKPSKQPDTGVSSMVISVNNGDGVDKTKKAPIDTNTQENGPSQNAEKDGGADEGRKSKDGKGIRAFKFALVDLVKELLKPNWKEGQIDKEAYKTIVKKVVDKVTGTIQAANIPQTQEKIEQYLSFSKPKLTKLIQAYVDKFQKGKE